MSRPSHEKKNKIKVFVPPTPVSFYIRGEEDPICSFLFPAAGRAYDLQVVREQNTQRKISISINILRKDGAESEIVDLEPGYNYIGLKFSVKRGDILYFEHVEENFLLAPCHICFLYELNPRSRNMKYLDLEKEKRHSEGVPTSNSGYLTPGFEIRQANT